MLKWIFARSSPGERFAEDYARRTNEEGRSLSENASRAMLTAIMAESVKNAEVAKLVSSGDISFLESVELQFLWGVHHEFVQTKPLPTNGYDRILVHLIDWLVNGRGQTFENARQRALATQRLFNEADPVFDMIANSGKTYFHGHEITEFSVILAQSAECNPQE